LFISQEKKNRLVITRLSDYARRVRSSQSRNSRANFSHPTFVIKKRLGGWRFILNLKQLNKFIVAPHFKMENWKTVVHLFSPGDFLATIDLEDAYLLLPIHQNDRKFLRFRFRDQLFEFRVLPFGLASAPFIFTKILKPVLYSLRGKGYFSVNYLDFLLMAQSHDQCLDNIAVSVNLLSSLGFVINKQKSVLRPSRSCRFFRFYLRYKLLLSLNPGGQEEETSPEDS